MLPPGWPERIDAITNLSLDPGIGRNERIT
jgi:hypothetical protein